MRITLVHNRYLIPGGEDVVFAAESALLRSHGHEVSEFVVDNQRVHVTSKARLAANTIWSRESRAEFSRFIDDFRPDIAHFHNTFPLLSPAIYSVCQAREIPVIQTLHNYRLICPGATLFRSGGVCCDCVGRRVPWPGVVHGCYRGSRQQSGVVLAMTALHRGLGTYRKHVDCFIALTEFARDKLIEGGLDADQIVVKPNFVLDDPGPGEHDGEYALFVGRLSEEKGIRTLCESWRGAPGAPPLKIAGDGPLKDYVEKVARTTPTVEYLGRRSRDEILRLMKDARLLVVPSLWYEGFPMVIAEAFATGLPTIASRLGSMESVISDGDTGLLFDPGKPESLGDVVQWACQNDKTTRHIGRRARQEFERKYTGQVNYDALMEIYGRSIDRRRSRGKHGVRTPLTP